MARNILTVITATIGAVLLGLVTIGPIAAQGSPSASRAFDKTSVAAAGDPVVVTVSVQNATQGVVTETLPSGFSYVSSSLDSSAVRQSGQNVSFILADSSDNPFTYTVNVSATGSISGKLTVDRTDYNLTGDSTVTVAASTAPSASRAFDKTSVAAAGDPVVVTVSVQNATQGVVTETLPSGFSYVSSSLDSSAVRQSGQNVSFILADSSDNPFTYTVNVSATGSISGKLTVDRTDYNLTGDSTVTVAASTAPSASRAFDKTSVAAAGDPVVVTVSVQNATQGVVTETLPSGFSYVSSSLDSSAVRQSGQNVSFILADSSDNPFTYTVNVSATGSISGKLTVDRTDYNLTGDSKVTVQSSGGGAPGPTPTPSNRDPVFTEGNSATRTVAENTAAGQDIGNPVSATDGDGDSLTYTLSGSEAASFSIAGSTGQLRTRAALDYEVKNSYTVTVRAADPSNASDTITVTITVDNVEEAGTVSFNPQRPAVGTALTASLSDPDGGITGTTWQWAKSATMSGAFTDIAGATNAAYTPVQADDNNYLRATASYTDAEGPNKTAEATTPAVGTAASLVNQYDTNNDGSIQKLEYLAALDDYLDGVIERDALLPVLTAFTGAGS